MKRHFVLALAAMLALGACAQTVQQSPLAIAQQESEQLSKLTDRAVVYARRPTCGTATPAATTPAPAVTALPAPAAAAPQPCATPAVRRELANAAANASLDNQAALTAAMAKPIDTVAIGAARLKSGQTRAALEAILKRENVP